MCAFSDERGALLNPTNPAQPYLLCRLGFPLWWSTLHETQILQCSKSKQYSASAFLFSHLLKSYHYSCHLVGTQWLQLTSLKGPPPLFYSPMLLTIVSLFSETSCITAIPQAYISKTISLEYLTSYPASYINQATSVKKPTGSVSMMTTTHRILFYKWWTTSLWSD